MSLVLVNRSRLGYVLAGTVVSTTVVVGIGDRTIGTAPAVTAVLARALGWVGFAVARR